MKKLLLAAAVLSGILHEHGAYAKTLEDVLKDKGVITEQDYNEVTASQPTTSSTTAYTLGNGFTFTSADQKYQGSIGGFMQLLYTYTDLDGADNTAAKKVVDSSAFSMNRVKLYFNGYALTPDVTYKLQLNLTKGNVLSTGQMIEEAYINYRLIDAAQIHFGQDKIPFARQFITSSSTQEFVDLSQVATAFAPGYDFGLLLNGKIAGGLVTYSTGVIGGEGQGTVRANTDGAFAARIAVNPLGDMPYIEADIDNSQKPLASFGVNYFGDTVNNNNTGNLNIFASGKGWIGIGSPLMLGTKAFSATESIDVNTIGVDGAFKWRGFFAQSEFFSGIAEGNTTKNTLRAQGFYAQAGYFVIPKTLEIAARYSYLNPNEDVARDHWVETTGAVSWYLNGHALKIQTDYTNIHKQAALAFNSGPFATDDHRIRVQAQIMF